MDYAKQFLDRLWRPLAALGLLGVPLAAAAVWQTGWGHDGSYSSEPVNRESAPAPIIPATLRQTQAGQSNGSGKTNSTDHSSSSVKQDVSISQRSSSTDGSSAKVEINGQPIDVPDSGEVHKTIKSSHGRTTIDISNSSSNSTDIGSSSSVNLRVESHSSSEASHD